jgi:hypothetical protein
MYMEYINYDSVYKILEKKKKESLHCLLHKTNLVIWNAVYDVSISTVLASRMKELPL